MSRRTKEAGSGDGRYLSPEEVAALLDAELLKPVRKMDMEMIREGLDYFYPFDAEADEARARASLESLISRHGLFRGRVRRRGVRRRAIVLAAVLILLLLTSVCSALGINLWKVAYEWLSDSLFVHLSSEGTRAPASDGTAPYASEIWGDALYEMMQECGIDVALPTWMPEEMELSYLDKTEIENQCLIIDAAYVGKANKTVWLSLEYILDYRLTSQELIPENYFEADNELREAVECNGKVYYILTNIDHVTIAWIENDVDVRLNLQSDRSNVISVIESIRRRNTV